MSDAEKTAPSDNALVLDWDDAVDAFRMDLNKIDGEDDGAIFPPDLIDSMIESSLSEPDAAQPKSADTALEFEENYDPAEPLTAGSVAPGRTSHPPGRTSVLPAARALGSESRSIPVPALPRFEGLANLDDLAPPPAPAPPPPPDQPSRERILDRGAKVALSTVRARRTVVHHRLAAPGSDGQLARVDLLCALAGKATADRAASLLTSAACLCEELGHEDRADELYRRAVHVSEGAVIARRALARLAFASKRDDVAEERLRSEALAEQVPAARAWTLHRLAIVQWLVHRDLPCALRTATEAAEAMPSELAHMLLRVRLASAAHADDLAYLLLSQEARLDVPALRAVWLVLAGRCLERTGAREAARETYVRALNLDSNAFDAALGIARTTSHTEAPAAYAQALLAAADALPDGKLNELLRRRAGRVLGARPETRAHGLQVLAGLRRPLSLRTAAELWAFTDLDNALSAAEGYAAASHGESAGAAHLLRGQLLRRKGDAHGAEAAWEAALNADPECELARVRCLAVSENDRAQGRPRAPGEDTQRTAAGPASQLALEPGKSADELELLSSASDGTSQPAISVVMLDAALEAGDRELAQTLLGENARTWEGAAALGTWLSLADIASRGGDQQTAEAARTLASEVDARSCVGTRAAIRAAQGQPEVSALFAREAAQESPARAGLAWLRASDAAIDPDERLRLLKIAYDAMPLSRTAFAALHAQARTQGEHELLVQLHTRRAANERDSADAAGHLVRAAMLRPADEAEVAAHQLAQARELAPDDPALRELVVRTGTAKVRAEALLNSADHTIPPFSTALRLAGAASFEEARLHERALIAYASVLSDVPQQPVADAGWDRTARTLGKLPELIDHRRRAVSTAQTDAARVRALEELLDLGAAATEDETCERARALLALRPQHPLALRQLERFAMRAGDAATLLDVETRFLASSTGPNARLGRLRLTALLTAITRPERSQADDFDRLVVRYAPHAVPTSWLARTLASAGLAIGDNRAVGRALDMLADTCVDPAERAASLAQRVRLSLEAPEAKLDLALADQLHEATSYPTSEELAGDLEERLGEFARAAASFEQAATRARVPRRAARLWARAASIHSDHRNDRPRALAAYRSAATADITFEDVEARIQMLLTEEGNIDALFAHTEAALRSASEPERRAELSRKLAQLQRERGDSEAALTHLQSALAEQPNHVGMLRDLAALHEKRGDSRAKAETLLSIVRASREANELRQTFLELAQLYEHELPDSARAESAYKRVLQITPDHRDALAGLFALYRRGGQGEQAEAMALRLLPDAADDDERVELMLSTAHLREERGDHTASEAALAEALGRYPHDIRVLRNTAAFYRRRGATEALTGHLGTAIASLRARIYRDLTDGPAWNGLTVMLAEQKSTDAVRVVTAAAEVLSLTVPRTTSAGGPIQGAGSAGLSELLDDLVFPDTMPAATRILFRHASEALNRIAPFDPKAIGAQRIDRAHPLRALAEDMARRAGMGELEVLVSRALPLAFVSVADSPAQIVVGEELLKTLSADEQLFLTARALKIARSHASITCRVRPDEMGLLLHALIRTEVSQHAPAGYAAESLEALAKRLQKQLSRKQSSELQPLLRELAGAASFDASRVYMLASTAGNRAGLLVTGAPRAAIGALLKLAGRMPDGPLSAEHVISVDEARDLLHFAIHDAHFEARQRAGADQR